MPVSADGKASDARVTAIANLWDALVRKHVDKRGAVSYLGIAQDEKTLNTYLSTHQNLKLDDVGHTARKALYINLYNAFMIASLLRYAREKKIALTDKAFLKLKINTLKVSGGNIWNGNYKINLAGQMLNLDDIEHNLLRGKKGFAALRLPRLDPRIHMAVNCAALSCPRVRARAYYPHNVEQMLDENMHEFVNGGKQLYQGSKHLFLNKIVLWYYNDFDNDKRRAGDYLAGFLQKSTSSFTLITETLRKTLNKRSKLSLRFSRQVKFFYDWTINDRRNFKTNGS